MPPDRFSSNGTPGEPFHLAAIGALYTGSERGLAADVLAARALGGTAHPVSTALIAAGMGVVTDVVEVPADTVSAQLEHLHQTVRPGAFKIGVLGNEKTVAAVFRHLERLPEPVPVALDLTLSGPSGETVLTDRGIQALRAYLALPEIVLIRRTDAELLAGMEIRSLDDAQVAAQRLARLGARAVLLRCGRLPARFFDDAEALPDWAVDLYFDGQAFSLFEAPWLDRRGIRGASSAFTINLLRSRLQHQPLEEAIQSAKAYVSEALRFSEPPQNAFLHYFF